MAGGLWRGREELVTLMVVGLIEWNEMKNSVGSSPFVKYPGEVQIQIQTRTQTQTSQSPMSSTQKKVKVMSRKPIWNWITSEGLARGRLVASSYGSREPHSAPIDSDAPGSPRI